jgi:hypothetical protein
MNKDYGGNRNLLRAGLLPAMAAVAVLAAACSSSTSSSSTGGSANYQKVLAYSECMRAHGVTNFPDPNAQGNIIQGPGAQDASNSSVFRTADNTCHSLLPSGGSTNGGAKFQQRLQEDLKLAQCMRSHGVPTFPDPKVPSPGSLAWDFSGLNLDIKSPQFQAAERACQSLNNSTTFPGT